VSLILPDRVVPSVPQSWPRAVGWLYSWVRSDHLGYRTISLDGSDATVASTTGKRWDLYVADLSTALTTAGSWTAAIGTDGRVTLAGASRTIGYPDRLGWLLGMGTEAGTKEAATTTSRVSRFVPPGGIPLMGITWESVDLERESELVTDRSMRQGGYIFGGARVWRWRLKMSRWAYEALCSGWCMRSKITLAGSSTTAISSSVPGGALTGHALGLAGAPTWTGPQQDIAEVTLVVAGAAT
jgi:hypothetical protein